MKNEGLLDALGQIEDEFVEEADSEKKKKNNKKSRKNTWLVCVAIMAGVALAVGICIPQLLADRGAIKDAEVKSSNDGPPNFVVNGITYLISPQLAVLDELPEGYMQAGEVNVGGIENCPYYTNSDIPEWIYVYHEVMTEGNVDSTGTLIRTDPHNAYVRYVDERLRGKELVSYNNEYYISMWSVEYYGDMPDVSKEYFDSMENTYGIRLEGDAPIGFDFVGITEFCGYDSIPQGALSSNQGAYEVFVSDNDPNVILVSTQWYTAASDEESETKHVGFNVYIRYDCPLN